MWGSDCQSGRTLRGGAPGTFWKPPSENPFLGKTKSTVKVDSWSAGKPPPGGPTTVLFS